MPGFTIGYPVRADTASDFAAMVEDYREHIDEVYFSWPGDASGRIAADVDRATLHKLEADLRRCVTDGIRIDLLFNANCYGAWATSRELEDHVRRVIDRVVQTAGSLHVVTTTSPAIARCVRHHAPEISVRASVNMRLRSPQAFAPIAELFDSWYLCRDVQRDSTAVAEAAAWSHEHGKTIGLLANSGCLRDCPTRTFHDNLVAHAHEVDESSLIADWSPFACAHHFRNGANLADVLRGTWIRPMDLEGYARRVDFIKLATRLHERPRAVLEAYTAQAWPGNLLDLFEPTLAGHFAPRALCESYLPDDWLDRTSTCAGRCGTCTYCADSSR